MDNEDVRVPRFSVFLPGFAAPQTTSIRAHGRAMGSGAFRFASRFLADSLRNEQAVLGRSDVPEV
jgi:hypothetical protein